MLSDSSNFSQVWGRQSTVDCIHDPIPDGKLEWAKIAEDITCVAQRDSLSYSYNLLIGSKLLVNHFEPEDRKLEIDNLALSWIR